MYRYVCYSVCYHVCHSAPLGCSPYVLYLKNCNWFSACVSASWRHCSRQEFVDRVVFRISKQHASQNRWSPRHGFSACLIHTDPHVLCVWTFVGGISSTMRTSIQKCACVCVCVCESVRTVYVRTSSSQLQTTGGRCWSAFQPERPRVR